MFIFRYRGLTKVVVCLLIVALLTTSINIPGLQTKAKAKTVDSNPTQTITSQTDNNVSSNQQNNTLPVSQYEKLDPTVSQLLTDKSDEYTNVYKNPDGTYTADFYLQPVNYRDATGKLQPIQSDIVTDNDSKDNAKGLKYKNEAGPVKVALPDNIVSNTPVQVSTGNYAISMMPLYSNEDPNQKANAARNNQNSSGQASNKDSNQTASSSINPGTSQEPTPSSNPSESPSTSTSPSSNPAPSASPSQKMNPNPSGNLSNNSANENLSLGLVSNSSAILSTDTIVNPSSSPSDNSTPSPNPNASASPSPSSSPSTSAPVSPSPTSTSSQSVSSDSSAGSTVNPYTAQPIKNVFDKKSTPLNFNSDTDKNNAIKAGKAVEKTTSLQYSSKFGNGVSVQYSPTNLGIKENIVLNQYTGQNSFDFVVSFGSLKPQITSTGDIQLTDPATNQVVADVPAGYVYDSYTDVIDGGNQSHQSNSVTYSLTPLQTSGDYKLTVTVDQKFLKDKNTVYPVTIDPSLNFTGSTIFDTFYSYGYNGKYANTDFHTQPYFYIGRDTSTGGYDYCYGYLIFYIYNYLHGYTINNAYVHAYEMTGQSPTLSYPIDVYRVNSGVYSPYTWNNKPTMDGSIVWAANQWDSTYQDYVWDVKSLCQAWANGTYSEEGMMLCDSNQQASQYREFAASGSSYSGKPPVSLEIGFTDNTPPVSSISTPSNNSKVSGNVTVTGTASDQYLSSWNLQYGAGTTPGSWTPINSGTSSVSGTLGTWNTSGLAPGVYTLKLTAIDSSNNTTTSTAQVSVPASVSISSPTAGSFVGIGNIPVSGSVSDANLKNWSLDYSLSTSPNSWINIATGLANITNGTLAQWNSSSLTDGAVYNLKLTATDVINNTNSTTIQVTADLKTPVTSITAPASNTYTNGTSVSVTGTATDTNLSNWYLDYGTGTAPTSWTNFANGSNSTVSYILTLPSQDGIYTVRLWGKDKAGNTNQSNPATAQITKDATPPTTSITAPANNGLVSNSFTITGTVTENNLNQWEIDYAPGTTPNPTDFKLLTTGTSTANNAISYNYNFNTDPVKLPDGPYTLRLWANDKAGNSNQNTPATVIIAKDTAAPTDSITAPTTNSLINGIVSITGTATDANLANWTLDYASGTTPKITDYVTPAIATGNSSINGTLCPSWDTSSLQDGYYTLRLRATDSAQNTTPTTIVVAKDIQTPTATFATLTDNGFVKADKNVNITGTAFDACLTSWSLQYGKGISPSSWSPIGSGTTTSITNGNLGTLDTSSFNNGDVCTLWLQATDFAGHTTQKIIHLTVDSIAPVSTITPLPSQYIKGNVTISGTASDTNISTWVLEFGSGSQPISWTTINKGSTSVPNGILGNQWDTTKVSDGTYTVRLTTTDLAGNVTQTTIPVTIENTPPQLAINWPANQHLGGTITVPGTANDPVMQSWELDYGEGTSPASWTTITTGNNSIPSGGTLCTWNTDPLLADVYTLRLTATDLAGNTAQTFLSALTKDVTPLAIPANVKVNPHTQAIDISWNAVTYAQTYDIQVNGKIISGISGTSYTYTGFDLTPGSSYTVSVSAVKPDTTGNWSQAVTGTTKTTTQISSQTISSNTTWSTNDSPYVINGPVTIAQNAKLTINPNVIIESNVGSSSTFVVNGTLDASQGTSSQPIIFTSTTDSSYGGSGQTTYWDGFKIGATGEFDANNAVIRYMYGDGSTMNSGIYDQGKLDIENSSIYNTNGTDIYITGAPLTTKIINDTMDFGSSTANCNHITVSTTQQADVNINNDTLKGTGMYGINVSSYAGGNLSFSSDTVTGATSAGYINLSTFNPTSFTGMNNIGKVTLDGGTLLKNIELPQNTYLLNSAVTIPGGMTLTFDPGAVTQSQDSLLNNVYFDIFGTLNATGTADNRIVFTSTTDPAYNGDESAYWGGFRIESTGEMDSSYCDIRYIEGNSLFNNSSIYDKGKLNISYSKMYSSKGNDINITGTPLTATINNNTLDFGQLTSTGSHILISTTQSGDININNNTLLGSGSYGINVSGYAGGNLTLNSNSISGTTYTEGYIKLGNFNPSSLTGIDSVGRITLDGGTLQTSIVLPKDTYLLNSSVTIPAGKSLTVVAGSVIQSKDGVSFDVAGTLTANGTTDQPIIFTSTSDPLNAGNGSTYWNGFKIESTGEMDADYVRIRYTQGDLFSNYGINDGGKISLTDSEMVNAKSGTNGITVTNPANNLTIQYDAFSNINTAVNNPNPSTAITAAYNYWDSDGGPNAGGCNASSVVNSTPYYGYDLNYMHHFGDGGANVPSGNYSKTYTDIEDSNTVETFAVNRMYNSRLLKANTLLGKGWMFNFEGDVEDGQTSVTVDNNSVKNISIPNEKMVYGLNGALYIFTTNADGTFTSTDSKDVKLVKNTDGSYTLTNKDQTQINYNSGGKMNSIVDKYGNTAAVNYATDGKISSVVDSAGNIFTFSYNTDGTLDKIIDQSGNREVDYQYQSGVLTGFADSTGAVTHYAYDSAGFLSSITDPDNNLIESMTYTHDVGLDRDKITSRQDANGDTFYYAYDDNNNIVTVTDSNSKVTKQWYDQNFNITKEQDAENGTTSTAYKSINGGTQFGIVSSQTDRNGNTTNFQTDDNGNVTQIKNPDGSTKNMTYDSKNNLLTLQDENNNMTTYTYDSSGVYLLTKTQPEGAVTQYSYYSNEYPVKGLLKTTTDPVGETTTCQYYNKGYLASQTNSLGETTQYTYNSDGLETDETTPSGDHTKFVYDGNGNQIEKVLSGGETYRTVYDKEGNAVQDIQPEQYDSSKDNLSGDTYYGDIGTRNTYYPNGKIETSKDAQGNVTSYIYDKYGNIATETDPNGAIYRLIYDGLNRLTQKYYKENAASAEVMLEEDNYAVLSNGNTKVTIKQYYDGSNYVTESKTYDYANRLIQTQNPDGTTVSTAYNPNGTKSQTTDAAGQVTYYNYDHLNRLKEKWVPIEQGPLNIILYSYTSYSYDNDGRKTFEESGKTAQILNVKPSDFVSTTYVYNSDGTLRSKTSSSGAKSEYQYDSNGVLSSQKDYTDSSNYIQTDYTNNELGKPSTPKLYVRKGDISGNSFDDNTLIPLETNNIYDDNGNLHNQMDPDNVTTTFEYDHLNRQLSVSQPGLNENGDSVSIQTSKAYDRIDSTGNFDTETDANGNTTRNYYDGLGRQTKVVDAKGGTSLTAYDLLGRVTAKVSPLNYIDGSDISSMNRTEYTYDTMGRVKTMSQVYYDTQSSQWKNYVAEAYQYDRNGNVIKKLDSLGYAAGTGTVDQKIDNGYGTVMTYNLANQLISTTDPLGNTISDNYDAMGRKISETNANGNITVYTYDDAGNVLSTGVKKDSNSATQIIQTKTYDTLNNPLTVTDGNGNITTYTYNALGKVQTVTYPSDSSMSGAYIVYSQYDAMGDLTYSFDNNGVERIMTYDNQNRLLSTKEQKTGGSEAVATSTAYDKNGNKCKVIDGNGNETDNMYDDLDRLKATTVTVSGITQTTSYTYDADGNQLTTTDWLGNVTTNVYDPLNREIKKIDANNVTIEQLAYNNDDQQIRSTDALGDTISYTYDKNKRMLTTTEQNAAGDFTSTTGKTYDKVGNESTQFDGNNNTTLYSYDEFNRLIQVTDPQNNSTKYTYDLNGNKLTQTDGNGNVVTYEYNAIGKVIRVIANGGRTGLPGSYAYDATKTQTYTYTVNGNVASMTDRNGNTKNYNYNSHNNVLSQTVGAIAITYTYDGNGNQLTMTDLTGTTSRTYDTLDRVLTNTVPVIGTTTYVYDVTQGLPAGYAGEQTTDPAGNVVLKVNDKVERLASVTDETGGENDITAYEYYDNGAKKSVTYGTGAREEYTYKGGNLLTELINRKPDGSVMDTYDYTYDSAKNQTSKHEIINGVVKGATSYTYDAMNRLLTVTEPTNKTTTYTYDAAGNRATQTVADGSDTTVDTYTYDTQNRLTDVEEKLNNVESKDDANVYDNNGNELTDTATPYTNGEAQTPVVTASNSYDALNELTQNTKDGIVTTYAYNGEGLRVMKTSNNATTRYMYEGLNVTIETDNSGNQTARNVYGTNLLTRYMSGVSYNYIYNGHADVTALVNSTNGIVDATYYYDAFGNITDSTGNVNNNIAYAGYQYDKESGYYYLNARMYDPKVARFLQEDTFSGDANDPLSLNLYTYVKNDPLMYDDPTGHSTYLAYPNHVYVQGDSGANVTYIQNRLITLKYATFTAATAYFGSQTDTSVRNFQSAKNLTIDGKVGQKTWNALFPPSSTPAPTPPSPSPTPPTLTPDSAIKAFGNACQTKATFQFNPPQTLYTDKGKDCFAMEKETYNGYIVDYYYANTLNIDTDGSKHTCNGKQPDTPGGPNTGINTTRAKAMAGSSSDDIYDEWYQNSTSPFNPQHGPIDSSSINYVVCEPANNATLGDFAIVIDTCTNKEVYAIVGDSGNTHEGNEVSIATAANLGEQPINKVGKYYEAVLPQSKNGFLRYLIVLVANVKIGLNDPKLQQKAQ